MYVDVHVKRVVFLSSTKSGMRQHILVHIANTIFNQNPSSASRVVPREKTERHHKPRSRLSKTVLQAGLEKNYISQAGFVSVLG
jgi:hypothetical protein